METGAEKMIRLTKYNGHASRKEITTQSCLRTQEHISHDIFGWKFPQKRPTTNFTQMAKHVRVLLRKYTQDQRTFLSQLTNVLLETGNIYPKTSREAACATLLIPKPGPVLY